MAVLAASAALSSAASGMLPGISSGDSVPANAHANCDPFELPHGRGRVTTRMPGAALRSQLAVLRRPQAPGDRLRRDQLTGVRESGFFRTIAAGSVRLLANSSADEHIYLVPGNLAPVRLRKRCLRALSRRERRRALRIERSDRRLARHITLFVANFGLRGSGLVGGIDAGGLRQNLGEFGFGDEHHMTLGALVPDDVASVEVRFEHGKRTRTATVSNNVWTMLLHEHAPAALDVVSMTWRRADGSTIKRFSGP